MHVCAVADQQLHGLQTATSGSEHQRVRPVLVGDTSGCRAQVDQQLPQLREVPELGGGSNWAPHPLRNLAPKGPLQLFVHGANRLKEPGGRLPIPVGPLVRVVAHGQAQVSATQFLRITGGLRSEELTGTVWMGRSQVIWMLRRCRGGHLSSPLSHGTMSLQRTDSADLSRHLRRLQEAQDLRIVQDPLDLGVGPGVPELLSSHLDAPAISHLTIALQRPDPGRIEPHT
mmetsp:Transcript_33252/g.105881  ORF Transcript_33252/g.105881 Transcript_33252/m.105881 type:complete len:229 (+) Transcript_33252:644-1330(+)